MAGTDISTGDFAKALEPLSGRWFDDGFNDYKSDFEKIFEIRKLKNRSYVEDALVSGLGLLQATGEGEATPYDKMQQGYIKRYNSMDYRSAISVTQNMINDGMDLGLLARKAKELGRVARHTQDIVAMNVLNRAENSSYVGGDGVELLSSAHPTRAGNMRNELTIAADLSETTLEQMDLDLADIKDDRGLRLSLTPQKLVIPRALKFEAHRVLKSSGQVYSSDNTANAINEMNLFPQGVVVSDRLTDSDAYFILTDAKDGLQFIDRQSPVMTADKDFETDSAKFKVHMRMDAGWTNWRHVFGTGGGA